MSVIFKTLKKLRGQTPEEKEGAKKLRKGRNIYSFRRIFFSPLGVFLITVFIFFSGMATLYGVRYLKDYLEQKSRESFLVKDEKAQAVKTETGKERDELPKKEAIFEEATTSVPPPPKAIPIEKATPGKLYLPSKNKEESSTKEIHTIRYIPPRSLKGPKKQEKNNSSVGIPQALPISQKETSKSLTHTPASLLPKSSEIRQTSSPDILRIKLGSKQESTDLPPVKPDIVKSDRAKSPAIQPQSKALPKITLKEKSANAGKRVLPERPVKLKGRKKTEDERIYLENVEKSVKIASLVAKIQRAIDTESSDHIEDLIEKLTLLKGEENNYVLKIRAFLCIRQDDYKSAVSLLNEVLSKNENDLEAGINMAIVEIKTGQISEARNRLAKLKEIYPENTLIPELIQKLK